MVNNLTMGIHDLETYNPGCYDEVNKIITQCTQFKADVLNTVSTRFQVAIIILVVLIFIRLFLYYRQPAFTQTEFYKTKIEYRIDFIISIIAIIIIGMMFI